MRMPKFEYHAPETLDAALQLLAEKGAGAHLLAGGTDLLVKMNHGMLKPKTVIALKGIPGLSAIKVDPQKGLTIGATVLLAEVAAHPDILRDYPAVAYAANKTANVQIRNMGTVAGNLCNAAPSADNAPTLVAMGGEAVLMGPKGERRLPLDRFFKGPGQTAMDPAEIMTAIHVPTPPPGAGVSYQHISARGKVDISAVCVGAMVTMDGNVCSEAAIVLGAVAPIPMRARKAEEILRGKEWSAELAREAAAAAEAEARPIADVRASAEYRKQMVAVLTRRALEEARARAAKR
ncbi:FAD binding domain in molybdopterin dehydrogenase [uncultured Desulfatiglans sp.]|uniref:FAD binding domain in molybdopterin dehydrogenase n=1 Tax=Uncultured Desulfatiglans sp. TaxID=1748965 RepID=A0A653AIZ8_UNCDX|nr:FAD binding domain in molybdopterin dehydrogenase [uncultured Desulfatiglans sp.]